MACTFSTRGKSRSPQAGAPKRPTDYLLRNDATQFPDTGFEGFDPVVELTTPLAQIQSHRVRLFLLLVIPNVPLSVQRLDRFFEGQQCIVHTASFRTTLGESEVQRQGTQLQGGGQQPSSWGGRSGPAFDFSKCPRQWIPFMDETKTPAAYQVERLLEEGIKPHAETLLRLASAGQFACVLFEVDRETKQSLRPHGWRAGREVFPIGLQMLEALKATDAAARRFFSTTPDSENVRIFAMVHKGTILVNWSPSKGYWIEPGSTDTERAQGPS